MDACWIAITSVPVLIWLFCVVSGGRGPGSVAGTGDARMRSQPW